MKESIVSKFLEKEKNISSRTKEIKETDLVCSCGGVLIECRTENEFQNIPKSKKHRRTRINKKWEKKFYKNNRTALMIQSLLSFPRHPFFKCKKCGVNSGFYKAMGMNMLKIEPLE